MQGHTSFTKLLSNLTRNTVNRGILGRPILWQKVLTSHPDYLFPDSIFASANRITTDLLELHRDLAAERGGDALYMASGLTELRQRFSAPRHLDHVGPSLGLVVSTLECPLTQRSSP